jgi:hypothetical protein
MIDTQRGWIVHNAFVLAFVLLLPRMVNVRRLFEVNGIQHPTFQ